MLLPLFAGAALTSVVVVVIEEPLGRAFGALFITVLLLPFAADDLGDDAANGVSTTAQRPAPRWIDYSIAVLSPILAAAFTAGAIAALVIAAVASSMIGLVMFLTAIRLPTRFAIALVIVQSILLLSWPVWAAQVLLHVNTDRWLQWLINLSPTFALNAQIAPSDPFTHRPLMYRLANLGQDISYAMPGSAWPSIVLHTAIAFVGFAAGRVVRRLATFIRAADGTPRSR